MTFKEALKEMHDNKANVKRPHWGGYWYWSDETNTIMIRTKDGDILDIRDTTTVYYTMSNIAADDWIIATKENTPQLGGETLFGFDTAIRMLKKGHAVCRKGWNGKGMFIYLEGAHKDIDSECLTGRATCVVGKYMYDNKIKETTVNAHIDMKTADNKVTVGWLASQTDMLANDWTYADGVGFWKLNEEDL